MQQLDRSSQTEEVKVVFSIFFLVEQFNCEGLPIMETLEKS